MNTFYKTIATAILGFTAIGANAQMQDVTGDLTFTNDLKISTFSNANKALTVCGTDTVDYPLRKATAIAALGLNNVSSGNAVGQYYNASDSVTVSGFNFFAWKSDTVGGISTSVLAEMYAVGSDSLPTGTPLASVSITVDTTFGTGQLTTIIKRANFTTPVLATQPYVLVVSNDSPIGVSVLSNSYTAGNGGFEDLASVKIGANWLRGSSVNVGGPSLNADFLIHPYVDYRLNSDFSINPDSIYSVPATISITNASSPIINDRMYNFNVAIGESILNHNYDFGNGGGTAFVDDSSVVYTMAQNYTITMLDTIRQYNGNFCVSSEVKTLAPATTVGLSEFTANSGTFQLYPNPAKGNLTLEMNTASAVNERLFIYSIEGKLVYEGLITSSITNIDVSNLNNGIYTIRVGNTTDRLVVSH